MLALLRNTHGCTLHPAVVVNLLYTKSFHHQTTFALHKTRGCIHGTVHKQILRSTAPDKPTFFFHPPNRTEEPSVYYFSLHANSNQEEGLVRWCNRVRDHPERLTDSACPSRNGEAKIKSMAVAVAIRHPSRAHSNSGLGHLY